MPDDEPRQAPQCVSLDGGGPRPLGDIVDAVVRRVIPVIPTRYKGVLYRSRTEARWAVFFDYLGITALYEPEGYDLGGIRYLPDFLLSDFGLFVEVKGEEPKAIEVEKARRLSSGLEKMVLVAIGPPAERRGVLFRPNHPPDAKIGELADLDHEGWLGLGPANNACFAECRTCPSLVIDQVWGDPDAWDARTWDELQPCGNPNRCGDRFPTDSGRIEKAIEAASNERFEAYRDG